MATEPVVTACVLSDLLLLLVLLGMCGLSFLGLHVLALRLYDPKRLLVFLLGTYLLAATGASILGYFWLSGRFSSPSAFWVACAGAVLAGLFAAMLYAFLGPATADRSLTAHFLVYLLSRPGRAARPEEIAAAFDSDGFLAKRYAECNAAGILSIGPERIRLTAKGSWLARLYALQLRALGLSRRSQHLPSFPPRD